MKPIYLVSFCIKFTRKCSFEVKKKKKKKKVYRITLLHKLLNLNDHDSKFWILSHTHAHIKYLKYFNLQYLIHILNIHLCIICVYFLCSLTKIILCIKIILVQ